MLGVLADFGDTSVRSLKLDTLVRLRWLGGGGPDGGGALRPIRARLPSAADGVFRADRRLDGAQHPAASALLQHPPARRHPCHAVARLGRAATDRAAVADRRSREPLRLPAAGAGAGLLGVAAAALDGAPRRRGGGGDHRARRLPRAAAVGHRLAAEPAGALRGRDLAGADPHPLLLRALRLPRRRREPAARRGADRDRTGPATGTPSGGARRTGGGGGARVGHAARHDRGRRPRDGARAAGGIAARRGRRAAAQPDRALPRHPAQALLDGRGSRRLLRAPVAGGGDRGGGRTLPRSRHRSRGAPHRRGRRADRAAQSGDPLRPRQHRRERGRLRRDARDHHHRLERSGGDGGGRRRRSGLLLGRARAARRTVGHHARAARPGRGGTGGRRRRSRPRLLHRPDLPDALGRARHLRQQALPRARRRDPDPVAAQLLAGGGRADRFVEFPPPANSALSEPIDGAAGGAPGRRLGRTFPAHDPGARRWCGAPSHGIEV